MLILESHLKQTKEIPLFGICTNDKQNTQIQNRVDFKPD